MRGWILAAVGLAALAVGAYTLLGPSPAGTDHIGAESRSELERVIEEAR